MARYESNIEHAGFYGTRASYRARMVRGWFRVDRDAGTKRVNEEETKKKTKKQGHGAMYEDRMMRENHTPVW